MSKSPGLKPSKNYLTARGEGDQNFDNHATANTHFKKSSLWNLKGKSMDEILFK